MISLKNTLEAIKTKLNAHDKALSVDYIVEQGTSGIWTYRKWNSGTMEMWFYKADDGYWTTSSWGGFYWCNKTFTFPVAFASMPVVSGSAVAGTGYSTPLWSNPTKTSVLVRMAGSQAGNTQGVNNVQIHAIGKWK